MDPITLMAVIDGALTILEKLAPSVQQAFNSGAISPEDQKALRDRIDALMGSETFSGPEWSVEPNDPPAAKQTPSNS